MITRHSSIYLFLVATLAIVPEVLHAFTPKQRFTPSKQQQQQKSDSTSTTSNIRSNYRTSTLNEVEEATGPITINNNEKTTTTVVSSFYEAQVALQKHKKVAPPDEDPALVEFVPLRKEQLDQNNDKHKPSVKEFADKTTAKFDSKDNTDFYPFAAMLQGSAPYIASHAGKTVVIHLPGELLEDTSSDTLLQDIALCWLLGMKIVIVIAGRYNMANECTIGKHKYSHECQNALKTTNIHTLRKYEEESGYLRTEMERKLNKCFRSHFHQQNSVEGNVVSGNFYTARKLGIIRNKDFELTGYCNTVHTHNIQQVLQNNNDVVLLSTVGMSTTGELLNVNGYHLAAKVASELNASKLIYMANQGAVLRKKGEQVPIQELPLSFAKSITDYHHIKCHNTGFATFQNAKEQLDPEAVELLLHLGWSTWAVENGVQRAHMVNPANGALLEELFTAKNGANTCLYHDNEREQFYNPEDDDDNIFNGEEYDELFDSINDDNDIIYYA